MLGIIILIFVCAGFYKAAESRGRRGWLWVILSLISYFGTQFATAIVLTIIYQEEYKNHEGLIIGISFGASVLSLVGLYLFLRFKINEHAADNFLPAAGISNSTQYKEGNSNNPFITPDK
jgi:hypothetical protein